MTPCPLRSSDCCQCAPLEGPVDPSPCPPLPAAHSGQNLESCQGLEQFSCSLAFFLFFSIYLFMIVTEREREAETQAEGEAGSMHREPDVGFDPTSPGSRPGPKAGAKPLRHPGIPCSLAFFIDYRTHGLWGQAWAERVEDTRSSVSRQGKGGPVSCPSSQLACDIIFEPRHIYSQVQQKGEKQGLRPVATTEGQRTAPSHSGCGPYLSSPLIHPHYPP